MKNSTFTADLNLIDQLES